MKRNTEVITFGRDEEFGLEGATLTKHQFEVLGTVLLTHLESRAEQFQLTLQLVHEPTKQFTGLDAFLLLEELSTLLTENFHGLVKTYLTVIYNALERQTYSSREMTLNIA